jgi:hypothetical protein
MWLLVKQQTFQYQVRQSTTDAIVPEFSFGVRLDPLRQAHKVALPALPYPYHKVLGKTNQ